MRNLSLICAALVLMAAGQTSAKTIRDHRNSSQGGGAYTLNGPPVFELKLTFQKGETRSCETRNLSIGADPVLHLLLGADPDGRPVQVGMDDDSAGNLNARVTLRSGAGGTYLLVMRAAGSGATGTAELWCDGRIVAPNLPVGGAFKRLEALRAGERLHTITLPGGPLGHHLYLLDDNGNMLRRSGSGAADSVNYAVEASSVVVAMVASNWINDKGELRLVRNDAPLFGHDVDGDGLGNELEKAIGTCSSGRDVVGNWDCSRTVDMRDTDGDGLSDRVELLGDLAELPFQQLPRWGANPLHKDLFIEVDYGQRAPGDPDQTLSPTNARGIAAIYGDPETDPLLALRNAQSLNNPDGKKGISLHLDSGVSPALGTPIADLTIYGDWGGHNVVAPIKSNSEWARADPSASRGSQMDARRRPYFHYALGDPTSGGQAGVLLTALNLPLFSAPAASHELGHTLGLEHFGPTGVALTINAETIEANCKPNYPSIMSYAYLDVIPGGFSDGYGRVPNNNANLVERKAVAGPTSGPGKRYLTQLRDVFGYPIDPTDGSVDWNRDGVISDAPVRAYVNENGSGCEFTRFNAVKSSGLSQGPVSLARLGKRTFLAYVDERDHRLHISHTDDRLLCLKLDDSCGSLSDGTPSGSWNVRVQAVDATVIDTASGRRILVVIRAAAGLHELLLDETGAVSGQRLIAAAPVADSDLSVASNGAIAWLATRETDGNAAVRTRAGDGAWSAPAAMQDSPVYKPYALRAGTSPALLWSRAEGGRLYAALPLAPDGEIALRYLLDDGHWSRTGWIRNVTGTKSIGRPAMAIEPVAAGSPLQGRLRIAYLSNPDADGRSVVRMLTQAANSLSPSSGLMFRDTLFDNQWYYAKGVGLLFEAGIDDQLRAAVATAIVRNGVSQPHVVELRPLAGGIVNLVQRNWDDWQALGLGLCIVRRDGGSQMKCAPWPYKTPSVVTGNAAPLPPLSPLPPQPQPNSGLCHMPCGGQLRQCLADHGNPNICRQEARICQQACR